MIEERAMLWADALESGEFTQGKSTLTHRLGSVDKDCCLGVACKVAMRNGLKLRTQMSGGDVAYEDETAILPRKVAEWYGLSTSPQFPIPDGDDHPHYEAGYGDQWISATIANDDAEWSFEKIAKIIRENWAIIR